MNEAMKKAIAAQEKILAAAKADGERNLTEEETREFNGYQEIIDALRSESAKTAPSEERSAPTAPEEKKSADEERSAEKEEKRAEKDGYTRETATEVMTMCREFSIEPDSYIKRGLSTEEARREIMEELKKRQKPVSAAVTRDEGDKARAAMTDGLLLRGGADVKDAADGAENYRGMSLKEIAAEAMERFDGQENTRHMSNEKLLTALTREFYNPESVFPSIMDDVIKKSYIEGLTKANVSFDKWVRFGTLPNFKKTTNHEYIMSLGGRLEKVSENGELKAYVPEDVAMPERQLETYGRQFTMSRKAFIDDDIGLLTTMPRRYGEMSKRTQNEAVYSLLLDTKKIYDGKTLFDKSRKNALTDGTGVTLEAIQKMIYMIGIQKDEAGNQLALTPDIFIVPFGLGVEVQKLLLTPTFYSADGTFVNPYYGKGFEVIEDVTLNGMIAEGEALPWFMGVKNEIIEVDYLNGQREATIRRSEKAGQLGFIWDVYFDFGVSMLHPQAICKNPGVTVNFTE